MKEICQNTRSRHEICLFPGEFVVFTMTHERDMISACEVSTCHVHANTET